jgi:hypothetical protein
VTGSEVVLLGEGMIKPIGEPIRRLSGWLDRKNERTVKNR